MHLTQDKRHLTKSQEGRKRGPRGTSEEAKAVAGRILELRRDGERDADFAKRLGMTPQQFSHLKKPGSGASLDVVIEVSRRTGVSVEWLLFDRGPMYGPRDEGEAVAQLDAATRRLLVEIQDVRRGAGLDPMPNGNGNGTTSSETGEGVHPAADAAARAAAAAEKEKRRRQSKRRGTG